jgi:hypothetical protein
MLIPQYLEPYGTLRVGVLGLVELFPYSQPEVHHGDFGKTKIPTSVLGNTIKILAAGLCWES